MDTANPDRLEEELEYWKSFFSLLNPKYLDTRYAISVVANHPAIERLNIGNGWRRIAIQDNPYVALSCIQPFSHYQDEYLLQSILGLNYKVILNVPAESLSQSLSKYRYLYIYTANHNIGFYSL